MEDLLKWIAALVALATALFGFAKPRLDENIQIRKEQREEARKRNDAEMAAKASNAAEHERVTASESLLNNQANAYRERLEEALSSYSLLDWPRPITLADIHVDLLVEEYRPSYQALSELNERFRGDADGLLRATQEEYAKRASKALKPEYALSGKRWVVFVGDPGAGKSTTLRYLGLSALQKQSSDPIRQPVFIELRFFVESGKSDLQEYIIEHLALRYGFSQAGTWLSEQFQTGKAVLLLDGLDEVYVGNNEAAAKSAYDHVTNEINNLKVLYPRLQVALTCRLHGWRGGLQGFHVYRLLELTSDQINTFIRQWFAGDPTRAEDLSSKLASNVRMQTLASNPLLLSLIAIIYESDLRIPDQRAQLYKRCVEVLLEAWDSSRKINRVSLFTQDVKLRLLQQIAWYFQVKGLRYFGEEELLRVITRFADSNGLDRDIGSSILAEIAGQYGLLKEQSKGWYGFLHLTLQEYFAARYAVNEPKARIFLIGLRQDTWWQEVFYLLGGLMDDASSLILGILGRAYDQSVGSDGRLMVSEDEPIAVDDDLFQRNLFLAGQMLAEIKVIGVPGLRERIVDELMTILVDSSISLDRDRAAQVLLDIGDDVIVNRIILEIESERRTPWILEALQNSGNAILVPKLLLRCLDKAPSNKRVLEQLATALGQLRVTAATQRLLVLLDFPNREYYSHELIEAIANIGDPEATATLLDIIEKGHLIGGEGTWQDGLVAARSIREKSALPRLIELLHQDGPLDKELGLAIGKMADETTLPQIIATIRDPEVGWLAKWKIVTTWRIDSDYARQELLGILHSDQIDADVKVAVATALGHWGVQEAAPYLRRAITERVVAPSYSGPRGFYYDTWGDIFEALSILGDKSMIDDLLPMLSEVATLPEWEGRITGDAIVAVARRVQSDKLLSRILELARSNNDQYTDLWKPHIYYLNEMVAQSSVTLLREAVERFRDSDLTYVIKALGDVADDAQTQALLLTILSSGRANSLSKPGSAKPELYEALYKISERTGIKVDRSLRSQFS